MSRLERDGLDAIKNLVAWWHSSQELFIMFLRVPVNRLDYLILSLADSNDNILIPFPNVRIISQHYDYMLMVMLKPISHSCLDKAE